MQHRMYDFIFIGNEHPIKGIDVLEYLLKKINGKYKFAIIGKLPKLKAKFTVHSGHNYDFFGKVTGNRKINILVRSTVLVLPSYQESFSMVACEALCFGVPVICFDLPTLKSVYNEGVVFVKNKRAMYNKMIELTENRWKLCELIEDILRRRYDFSWKKETRKVISESNSNRD